MIVKCIDNPWNMPYLKINETYEVLGNHPTRIDYFEILGESNVRGYYTRKWFENIAECRKRKLNKI